MSEIYIAIHIVCSMVAAGILVVAMGMEDENSEDRLVPLITMILLILLGPFTIGAIIGIAMYGNGNDEKLGTHDPSPTARGNSSPG